MSEVVGVDRISELPDPLVLHILSFLRTTEVVRTCVLSKRWSSMWLYVPTLRFDSREFDLASSNELEKVLKFQLFVNSVLLNHKALKLDRIFISSWYDRSHNTAAVRTWICHALRRNPRYFDIVYGGSSKLHMTQSIFTCASLEYLGFYLGSNEGWELVIPKIINLPRLERLRVGRVALGEEFIHTFFSACPFLEKLVLFECYIGFSDIYSQNLNSLIIDHCYVKKMLCISTPNLEYLKICFRKETVVKGVVLQEMGSLYIADFLFELDITNIPREFVLLSKISNVTSLRLEGSGIVLKSLLEKEVPNCLTFHNLTYLYIDGLCIIDDFDLVARFFCLLPNLEDLVLRNAVKKIATGEGRGDLARGTLKSKCLKIVEIQCPEGSNVCQLERVLLSSIEDPDRVRIILSSY